MEWDVEWEGLDEFIADAKREVERTSVRLGLAAFDSAQSGVSAAQHRHPYQDHTFMLTDTAEARKGAMVGDAWMVWPQLYGKFVNYGTSRARAYNFSDEAERAARVSLERAVSRIIYDLERKLESL